MKPEIKEKWVKALRSGKYSQCRHALHIQDDGFCCLGVLADLMEPRWEVVEGSEDARCSYQDGNKREESLLPITVCRWAGLDELDRNVKIPSRLSGPLQLGPTKAAATCLTELNDRGATFEEIADIIEKEL